MLLIEVSRVLWSPGKEQSSDADNNLVSDGRTSGDDGCKYSHVRLCVQTHASKNLKVNLADTGFCSKADRGVTFDSQTERSDEETREQSRHWELESLFQLLSQRI